MYSGPVGRWRQRVPRDQRALWPRGGDWRLARDSFSVHHRRCPGVIRRRRMRGASRRRRSSWSTNDAAMAAARADVQERAREQW